MIPSGDASTRRRTRGDAPGRRGPARGLDTRRLAAAFVAATCTAFWTAPAAAGCAASTMRSDAAIESPAASDAVLRAAARADAEVGCEAGGRTATNVAVLGRGEGWQALSVRITARYPGVSTPFSRESSTTWTREGETELAAIFRSVAAGAEALERLQRPARLALEARASGGGDPDDPRAVQPTARGSTFPPPDGWMPSGGGIVVFYDDHSGAVVAPLAVRLGAEEVADLLSPLGRRLVGAATTPLPASRGFRPATVPGGAFPEEVDAEASGLEHPLRRD